MLLGGVTLIPGCNVAPGFLTILGEAVGPNHSSQRRAPSALGGVAQPNVGIVASTIAAAVVALIVMLWRAIT